MTTIDLYESLTSLREETSNLFYKEINRLNKETEFCQLPIDLYTEEFENLDDCLIVDIINEINGGIYSVYVTKINKLGEFTGQDLNDSDNVDLYSIHDIANEYNKIELIEILEKL